MISTTGLNKTATAISNLIKDARYTLNNADHTIAIHDRKLVGNVLSIYVLLDNSVAGTLTKVELMDVDNEVYASQPDNIEKVDTKLLLVTFKFTIVEVIN